MTTDAAFTQLINDKAKCLQIGMKENNYRVIKKRFNDGTLTEQLKTYWLELGGYSHKIEWKNKSKTLKKAI